MSPRELPHARFLHEAVYYAGHGPSGLTALATPLLRQALAQGADIALACHDSNNRALVEALGDDTQVQVLPGPEIYQKAVTAVSYLRDLIEERLSSGSQGLCILGEVDFGTDDAGIDEWRRYEALLNQVMASFPVWALCAYGTHALPDPVLATAELTHPFLRQGGIQVPNRAYVDPAELMRLADSGGELVPQVEPDVTIGQVLDLHDMREQLHELLGDAGVERGRQQDVILAVQELVTNGLRHGQPPVTVRIWVSGGRAVCTISDRGPGFDDPFAGYVRGGGDPMPEGRFGLWLVRQLCDELVTARSSDGFTVRVTIRY